MDYPEVSLFGFKKDPGHGLRENERKADKTPAELLLRVSDSANTFGSLNSIAESLYCFLESCEVKFPPIYCSQLIGLTVREGKQAGNRIVGTADRCACRAALQAHSRG